MKEKLRKIYHNSTLATKIRYSYLLLLIPIVAFLIFCFVIYGAVIENMRICLILPWWPVNLALISKRIMIMKLTFDRRE